MCRFEQIVIQSVTVIRQFKKAYEIETYFIGDFLGFDQIQLGTLTFQTPVRYGSAIPIIATHCVI